VLRALPWCAPESESAPTKDLAAGDVEAERGQDERDEDGAVRKLLQPWAEEVAVTGK
jgi:hypothetical protein